jgi:hypothetical protein
MPTRNLVDKSWAIDYKEYGHPIFLIVIVTSDNEDRDKFNVYSSFIPALDEEDAVSKLENINTENESTEGVFAIPLLSALSNAIMLREVNLLVDNATGE